MVGVGITKSIRRSKRKHVPDVSSVRKTQFKTIHKDIQRRDSPPFTVETMKLLNSSAIHTVITKNKKRTSRLLNEYQEERVVKIITHENPFDADQDLPSLSETTRLLASHCTRAQHMIVSRRWTKFCVPCSHRR